MLSLHSSTDRIEHNARLSADIFCKQLVKPVRLDRGGEGKNRVHFFGRLQVVRLAGAPAASLLPSTQFLNFCCNQKRASAHNAFASEVAATAVDQFATQCAFVDAACDAIAESDEDAFSQCFIRNFALQIQSLLFRDTKELLMQRANLPRCRGIDAEPAKRIRPELIFRSVLPSAHQHPKIGSLIMLAKKIFTRRSSLVIGIPRQQIASLRERGEQARLMHAPVFLRGQQHARVTRMNRECEHATAKRCDAGHLLLGLECAQIQQQFFGVRERRVTRRFEPPEAVKVFDARSFERENDFGNIEPLDLR